jgi:deoxyhypusine monooxygenase
MGAISADSSIAILREYLSDPERTVRETCEIAIARIEWENSEEGQKYRTEGSSESHTSYVQFCAAQT